MDTAVLQHPRIFGRTAVIVPGIWPSNILAIETRAPLAVGVAETARAKRGAATAWVLCLCLVLVYSLYRVYIIGYICKS